MIRTGPLHTAPSFSAGTVQTGSTLDAAALQARTLTMESRQSSMSGTSDLPFGTELASRAPSEGLDTNPRSALVFQVDAVSKYNHSRELGVPS